MSVGQGQVDRALAAVTARFDVELDLLVVGETDEAGAFHRRDMHEDVLRAAVGGDEAVAFGGIEPFDGAGGHGVSPVYVAARDRQRPGPFVIIERGRQK